MIRVNAVWLSVEPLGLRAGTESVLNRVVIVFCAALLHSARINGRDPYAYLRYVLERLPNQPASRIDELLPHH